MNNRVYYFTVSGCGLFPFKCLSLDKAWPATETDAELIELACPTQAPRQVIRLASYERPMPHRWKEQKWPLQRIES